MVQQSETTLMTSYSDWPSENTAHGMLVAFGEFLSQHGVIKRMMRVPIAQKTRTFRPQTKLVELLAGIMSGMKRLEDLNDGARPLVKDKVVVRAWGRRAKPSSIMSKVWQLRVKSVTGTAKAMRYTT